MRLPRLWDFRWLSLLFLPSPEQGNALCLHPLLSSKRSVTAEDSEEHVLAQAIRKDYFPASGNRVLRVLCLFFGSFLREDYGCMFFSDTQEKTRICEFSKLINVSQVLSEPNVCCKITETSVLSKVTFIRLSENTDFFSEGKRLAILTFYISQNMKRLGMAADLSTELEFVETQKSVFETIISSVSLVLCGWEFL